jgi:hypothetical protein
MRVVLPTYRTNARVTNFTVTGDSINKNTFYNILLFFHIITPEPKPTYNCCPAIIILQLRDQTIPSSSIFAQVSTPHGHSTDTFLQPGS